MFSLPSPSLTRLGYWSLKCFFVLHKYPLLTGAPPPIPTCGVIGNVARILIEEAKAATAEGRFSEAIRKYETALVTMPEVGEIIASRPKEEVFIVLSRVGDTRSLEHASKG